MNNFGCFWHLEVTVKTLIFAFAILADLPVTRTSQEQHSTTEATTTTTKTTTATVECQPLPHDVLWQRIDRSRLGVDSTLTRPRRNVSPTGEETSRDQTAERRRLRRMERRHFRSSGQQPEVNLLGEHPGQKQPFDVYRDVQDGGREVTSSSRRKRKLSVDARTKRKKKKQNGRRHALPAAPSSSPWQCRLEKKWKRMREGVFPQRVQTGKCVARTCMMAMYECRPRKYAVRVLKRLSDRCNPLPVHGPNATYEEVWTLDYFRVTVACDCARMKPSGAYGTT